MYYGDKVSTASGGELDVDANVGGCQTETPVENIRWLTEDSTPYEGRYEVKVNYCCGDWDTTGLYSLEIACGNGWVK